MVGRGESEFHFVPLFAGEAPPRPPPSVNLTFVRDGNSAGPGTRSINWMALWRGTMVTGSAQVVRGDNENNGLD